MDDLTNKTNLYFDMYHRQGYTLKEIAREFNHSVNTIKKYISQHPKFKPPGRGNRTDRRYKKTASKVETKELSFMCPESLLERIDRVPGRNRKEKYIAATKRYLRRKNKPLPKLKGSLSDTKITFSCPIDLVKKLDTDFGQSLTRSAKLIAAIELLCEVNKV